jgi:hypothetical protein
MHCQICLSSESPTLLDMRSHFFTFNDQRLDLLSCFNYCKQIKIDNEQNPKICASCQPKLIMEYLSILVKSEGSTTEKSISPLAEIKEEPELNLDSDCILQNDATIICDAQEPKVEVNIQSVEYQIIFPVHEVKEEPELQLDGDGVAAGDSSGESIYF